MQTFFSYQKLVWEVGMRSSYEKLVLKVGMRNWYEKLVWGKKKFFFLHEIKVYSTSSDENNWKLEGAMNQIAWFFWSVNDVIGPFFCVFIRIRNPFKPNPYECDKRIFVLNALKLWSRILAQWMDPGLGASSTK